MDFEDEPMGCYHGIVVPIGHDRCEVWCEVYGRWARNMDNETCLCEFKERTQVEALDLSARRKVEG